MKMKKIAYAVAGLGLMGFVAAPALAASSKSTMSVSGVALIEATNQTNSYDKVLGATIHVANDKELIAGASLETGLYTRTKVKGRNGSSDSSTAWAQIEVRVMVDLDNDGSFDHMAAPGVVVFDKRSQTLNAVLGGVIESCTDTLTVDTDGDGTPDAGDGVIDITTECTVTDEEIELILDTMGAHHFNFVIGNLPQGTHYLEVQAQISSSGGDEVAPSEASALIGKGSFTVEEVRAVKSNGSPGDLSFDM